MRIFNKFVQSVKEPSNKNDIWFDGSVFRLYKQGSWTPITLTQEAMDRLIEYINGLNIYVIVDALPEKGEKGKIYILCSFIDDEYVEITEYVYDGKWKIVNNFNSIEIPYSPFEKGEGENSVILKGSDNKASGIGSISLGKGSTAEGKYSFASGNSVASGDYSHSEGDATVKDGVIRYTKAVGKASHAEGEGCHASSNGAHAEGIDTDAKMKASHAEGNKTQSNAQFAHAEGTETIAGGSASHAEGKSTITTNTAEHSEGQFNMSNKDITIHSVGVGKSSTNRKNAHEITIDGKHYILNVGGYDGTNPTTAKSVQEVINELVNKLNEITTND